MTKTLELTTNNHERQFVTGHEVPMGVLRSQFDYMTADEQSFGSFLKYKGYWYSIGDFMRLPAVISEIWDNGSPLREWHGYAADSYFSGVVIKISDDGETYRIGTYIQRG